MPIGRWRGPACSERADAYPLPARFACRPPPHAGEEGDSIRLLRRPAQHVIAERARIGEVGYLPAVQIVFGHAVFGKALEAIGVAGRLGAEQAVTTNLLGRAAVVDLIELVAAA